MGDIKKMEDDFEMAGEGGGGWYPVMDYVFYIFYM